MRYLLLTLALLTLGLTGCATKVTQDDLYELTQNAEGQNACYYYMGSCDKWDYIRYVGPNYETTYRICKCKVDAMWRYKYTNKRELWTPVAIVHGYRGPAYTKDETRVVLQQPSTYISEMD